MHPYPEQNERQHVRPSTPRSLAVLAVTFLVSCATEPTPPTAPATPDAVSALVATEVAATTVSGKTYNSSSKLRITWTAPTAFAPVRYDVAWTETAGGPRSTATATTPSITIAALKASTSYRFEITPCSATTCGTMANVSAETPAEAWLLQGSGNSVAGLTKIVSDGNVKLHAIRYGTGAPGPLVGTLVMYYGPIQGNAKGLAVARTSIAAAVGSPASFINFTSLAGTAGLVRPPTPALLVGDVATGQIVPMRTGGMRLFFEAPGRDGKTRILFLDTQDGYVGNDLNKGASTLCATQADYDTGGGCEPTVAIGVEGDGSNANARILNARQHKVGYPTETDWRWDGSAGTFMVFTTGGVTGCSTAQMNHGYAVWTGTAWQVQYGANGCPKLFTGVQAMHPLHLTGVRYKMYYGNPTDLTGKITTSNLPFLGPKMLIYADGARTGDATRVDFEDWESVDVARRVTFLWPDGTTLNATANGYIDDFTVLYPTGDPALQVLYVAITDGNIAPFAAAAVLVNP